SFPTSTSTCAPPSSYIPTSAINPSSPHISHGDPLVGVPPIPSFSPATQDALHLDFVIQSVVHSVLRTSTIVPSTAPATSHDDFFAPPHNTSSANQSNMMTMLESIASSVKSMDKRICSKFFNLNSFVYSLTT
ncbi:hypothetical protein U1Q18_018142, partial [Sarracenia purpurea var. burkii]